MHEDILGLEPSCRLNLCFFQSYLGPFGVANCSFSLTDLNVSIVFGTNLQSFLRIKNNSLLFIATSF